MKEQLDESTISGLVEKDDLKALDVLNKSQLISPDILKSGRLLFLVKSKEMLYFLLDNGADIGAQDAEKNTILHKKYCPDFIAYIKDRPTYRFNPNVTNYIGNNIFHMWCDYGMDLNHMSAHFSEPLNIDAQNSMGNTLLHQYTKFNMIHTLPKIFVFSPNPFLKNKIKVIPKQLTDNAVVIDLIEEYEKTYMTPSSITTEIFLKRLNDKLDMIENRLYVIECKSNRLPRLRAEDEQRLVHIEKQLNTFIPNVATLFKQTSSRLEQTEKICSGLSRVSICANETREYARLANTLTSGV